MKLRSLLSFVAVSTMALGAVACSGEAQMSVNKPEPKPAPEPKREDPPPPAPAPAPAAQPQLVGLPLTGSQIDVLGEIQYDTNSATIKNTPQNIGLLMTLATAGKAYPQISKLRVEGHTDSDGDDLSNQDLSERRAQSVVQWLVDNGIDRRRLEPVGCGERDPIETNSTDSGKARNRRTEFDIEEINGGRWDLATQPCVPNPQRKGYVAVLGTSDSGTKDVAWQASASSAGVSSTQPGQQIAVNCPQRPSGGSSYTVYGGNEGQYSTDSSVCEAAIHAGKLKNNGGRVMIEGTGTFKGFQGSTQNGVTSRSWSSSWSSFRFR